MLRRYLCSNSSAKVCSVERLARSFGVLGQPTMVCRSKKGDVITGGSKRLPTPFPMSYIIPKFDSKDDAERQKALCKLLAKCKVEQRYINEVAAAKSFTAAAQRGLLLGAAQLRNQVLLLEHATTHTQAQAQVQQSDADNGILAKLFEVVASVDHNALYVNLALISGTFLFNGFTPIQQLTIAEWIERQPYFNLVTRVLRVDSDGLHNRHIEVESSLLVDNSDILSAIKSDSLLIVSGVSGIGKTTTTLITLRKYHCIYLCQTAQGVMDELELAREKSESKRNERVVARLIDMMRPLLQGFVTKHHDGEVVLIIDELGQTPTFLRALCALYKPSPGENASPEDKELDEHRKGLWERLRACLHVKTLRLVAVGTGCDRPEGTVGSKCSMYTIIRMDDRTGASVRDRLLKHPKVDPCLRRALRCEASFELGRVYRALANPRVAAAFVQEATKLHRKNSDWVRSAPLLLHLAFETFFAKNSLRELNYRERADCFRCALALSLGGPGQELMLIGEQSNPIFDETDICTRFGLVSDNATRIEPRQLRDEDIAVPSTPPDALVVPKTNPHRYVMTAATVEMMLSSVFGISTQVRTGDGFERTMVDFVLVQLMAGSTKIVIAPVEDDPLAALKTSIRKLSRDVDVLVAMQLERPAHTPAQALEEVVLRAAAFVNQTQPTSDSGNQMTFAAVARNCDKACAADAFVVRGALTRKDNAHGWVPAMREEVCDAVSMQFKHDTKTMLSEYMVKAEFFKMGRVTGPDFAGYAASSACEADLVSVESFNTFLEKLADKRKVSVTLTDELNGKILAALPSFSTPSVFKRADSVSDSVSEEKQNSVDRQKPRHGKPRVERAKIFAILKECSVSLGTTSAVGAKATAAVDFVMSSDATVEAVDADSLFIVVLLPSGGETFDEQNLIRLHEGDAKSLSGGVRDISRRSPIAVHSGTSVCVVAARLRKASRKEGVYRDDLSR